MWHSLVTAAINCVPDLATLFFDGWLQKVPATTWRSFTRTRQHEVELHSTKRWWQGWRGDRRHHPSFLLNACGWERMNVEDRWQKWLFSGPPTISTSENVHLKRYQAAAHIKITIMYGNMSVSSPYVKYFYCQISQVIMVLPCLSSW